MDVKRLTFDLAVYEVQVTDNWCAPDYAKEIKKEAENALSELLLSMSNAITSNRKVLDSLRNEISAHAAVVNEMWDGVVDDMKENHKEVMMKLGDMPKSVGGEGVNILDVAKSFAVIQKPELIKELNK